MAAQADEAAGADRWVEHQQLTLARLDQLCAIFDDPCIPPGTVIKPAVIPASRLDHAQRRRLSTRANAHGRGLLLEPVQVEDTENSK